MTRDDVVREAREWIGTPFEWKQATKGRGCDCKGLVAGVAGALGYPGAATFYGQVKNYSEAVDTRLLKEGLAATFDKRREALPGDVLLLLHAGKPQHLGIFTGDGFIHSTHRCQFPGVRLTRATRDFASIIDSVWTWRGIDG